MGSQPLQVGPTSFKRLVRMLAAEQGPVHDDPGSIPASLDRALRKFFLHDAPYGGKSVLIHYLNRIVVGAGNRYRFAVLFFR